MAAHRIHHLLPLLAVQAVGIACGVIGVRLLSSLVPPEITGAYGLLLGTQLFGLSVTHHGLVQGVQRDWRPGLSLASYLRDLGRPLVIATGILGLGLGGVALVVWSTGHGGLDLRWWPWMLAINALTVVAYVTQTALQAEERYWSHFVVSAVSSLSRTFVPIALVLLAGATLAPLAGGFLVHTLLWAAAGWVLLACRSKLACAVPASTHPCDPRKQACSYTPTRSGAPPAVQAPAFATFAAAGLFTWLAANAVRWLAARGLSEVDTGFFILALNLAGIIPAAASLVAGSYTFPVVMARHRAGAPAAELWRYTLLVVMVAVGVGQLGLLLLNAVAPQLVGWVIHPRYGESLGWLLAAGGAALSTVSGGLFGNLLLARTAARACFWFMATSALARIGAMTVLATLDRDTFRVGLMWLPAGTLVLEYGFARWLLGRAKGGRERAASKKLPHPAESAGLS